MNLFDNVKVSELERREKHLTVFACLAISVLGIGTAVLMYPLVFSHQAAPNITLRVAFFGFCGLCLLLAVYLWDRQKTIQQLRNEMAIDRRRILEAQKQASVELLKTMPNFSSFQDRLPMEYRRTIATTQQLSILVIAVQLPAQCGSASERTAALGDAAKVISRKLREQDSIYILSPACFGVVLPGVDMSTGMKVSDRVSEGLSDAAGASNRFTYNIEIINYPVHASSAHELQEAVCALVPTDNSIRGMAEALK